MEKIDQELKDVELDIHTTKGEIKNLKVKIEEWEKEYGSHDQVMDRLVDLRGDAW